MSPMSESELETEIDRVEALITTATTSVAPTYQIDGIRVERSAYIDRLEMLLERLYKRLGRMPFAGQAVVDFVDE